MASLKHLMLTERQGDSCHVWAAKAQITFSYKPAQWRPLCDRGFDPQPSHTKDFKNGTSCSYTSLSIKKVELGIRTGQLSVSIM